MTVDLQAFKLKLRELEHPYQIHDVSEIVSTSPNCDHPNIPSDLQLTRRKERRRKIGQCYGTVRASLGHVP